MQKIFLSQPTMKHLLTALLLTTLLTSCSIDWNDEKNKKITSLQQENLELKSLLKNFTTPRNQECWKSKEVIEKQIQENLIKYMGGNFEHDEKLVELFYSPVKDSCLYSVYTKELERGRECNFHKIYNLSDGSELGMYSVDTEVRCDPIASNNAYISNLKKFK